MNLSKLPKEKRNQLVLVALATLIALGGLGFGLIRWQYGQLRAVAEKETAAETKRARVLDAIKRADEIEAAYEARRDVLARQEEDMAAGGDLYTWLVTAIRTFKLPYPVNIPSISQPTPPADVNLLPRFPYKQVTVRVAGTAYFHDLGRFIADFENRFPHIRVANLLVEPVATLGESAPSGDQDKADKEKLSFAMDIITLVKPGTP
jgi:hypothetical protein